MKHVSILHAMWKTAQIMGTTDAAYVAIARAYSELNMNESDPHAFNRMLGHLKTGVERPVDIDKKTGEDRGVIAWIDRQHRPLVRQRAA